MAARKMVMTQDEITLQAFEIETDIEVSEDTIEVDQIETVAVSNVSLQDWRKAMGYSK